MSNIDDVVRALAHDAQSLRGKRYDCECQVGGVDADYLHEVGKRIGFLPAYYEELEG